MPAENLGPTLFSVPTDGAASTVLEREGVANRRSDNANVTRYPDGSSDWGQQVRLQAVGLVPRHGEGVAELVPSVARPKQGKQLADRPQSHATHLLQGSGPDRCSCSARGEAGPTRAPVHGEPLSKRALDILFGGLLAIAVIPVIGFLAAVSAAQYRAWPFFVQHRVGYRGRPFRIVKIRTLPPCAPSAATKFVIAELHLPRIATFMRSTHLDELPQLFLVVLGRMSLVGPRPEMMHLHEQGQAEFARRRVTVRPGCTGLWQISRAASGMIWEAEEYDSYYLDHVCGRFDLWILVRTVLGLFSPQRRIELHDVPRWVHRRGAAESSAGAPASALPVVYPEATQLSASPELVIDLTGRAVLASEIEPSS